MWGLPSEYEQVQDQQDLDAHVDVEVVDDHPDWRKVTSDSTVYYFNVVTRETRWTL